MKHRGASASRSPAASAARARARAAAEPRRARGPAAPRAAASAWELVTGADGTLYAVHPESGTRRALAYLSSDDDCEVQE